MTEPTATARPKTQDAKGTPSRLRFVLSEAAGGLGDLGTFVPIVVGMVQLVGLDAATVLVFAGLMNILSGLVFGIPIAVQPMKAICALAIAVLAAWGLCLLVPREWGRGSFVPDRWIKAFNLAAFSRSE